MKVKTIINNEIKIEYNTTINCSDNTPLLQKELQGFELFILKNYDDFMEQERIEDEKSGAGIFYFDDKASFYEWLDDQDWDTISKWIEEYANEKAAIK